MSALLFSYDLHIHSCLSPCGDDASTPADLAGMCALAGLDIAALTDHNTCGNCRAFCQAAEAYGVLGICGMELTSAEEVHVICLFPDPDRAEAFSDYVHTRLPAIANKPDIFGHQIYRDAEDHLLGEEPFLLSGATSIGVYEVWDLVKQYGGICFPAHIDRPSFSLISQLGLWDPSIPFPLAEVSPRCPPEFPRRPDLRGVPLITNSDCHVLGLLPDGVHTMDLPEKTTQSVLNWLSRGGPGPPKI